MAEVGEVLDQGQLESNFDLEIYKVADEPPTIYYIQNFITEAEETYLIESVNKAPKPRWTQLSNRRLQNWGGIPHSKGMIAEEMPNWLKTYTEKLGKLNLFNGKTPNHVLVNEYTPGQGIMPHTDGPLFYPTISTINLGSHTVLNFYHPVSSPESSSNEELNQKSTNGTPNTEEVASNATEATKTGSLAERFAFSLLLEPRSLLILKDKTYEHFLHGIDETKADVITSEILNADKCGVTIGEELERSTRISLTIRHVPKTTKAVFKFGR